jgi:hypothetical protein
MVIYTVYPPEVVLEPPQTEEKRYFTVDFEGRTFLLELVDGQAQIVRLLSANPNDYLNPSWQPGTKFGFTLPGTQRPT